MLTLANVYYGMKLKHLKLMLDRQSIRNKLRAACLPLPLNHRFAAEPLDAT